MRRPTFGGQAHALLAKQWALQRRSWLVNVFLLLLPLFFCLLLLLLQVLVNEELRGRDFRCGCKCTSCCDWVKDANASTGYSWQCYDATSSRACSPSSECKAYNDSECGAQYSSYRQVAFCNVEKPPLWPPVLQVPANQYRVAGQSGPTTTATSTIPAAASGNGNQSSARFTDAQNPIMLLFTGSNRSLAQQLTASLLPQDAGVVGNQLLQAAIRSIQSGAVALPLSSLASLDLCSANASALSLLLGGNTSSSGGGAIGGSGGTSIGALTSQMTSLTQFLANYSITLGTAAETTSTLLLEPAFFAGAPLFGTSSGGGGTGGRDTFSGGGAAQLIIDPTQVLPLYYLSPNCSALGTTDNRMLTQFSCGLNAAVGVPLVCVTAHAMWVDSVPGVDDDLYCGWRGAFCSNQQGIQGTSAVGGSGGGGSGDGSGGDGGGGQFPSLVLDWGATDDSRLDLTLWLNNSNLQATLTPTYQRWAPSLNLAVDVYRRRLASALTAASNRSLTAGAPPPSGFRLVGLKGFPLRATALNLDFASLLGPVFFMWVIQLLLPTYVYALASERQGGQLGLMRQQGLSQVSYYAATYVWALALYCVFMLAFTGFGAAVGLNIFLKTDPGVQAVLYILWGHLMIAVAFWMSSMYPSTDGAVLASIAAVIFTGLVANLIVVQFVQSGPMWLATLLELIPSFTLFRCLWEMSQYAFLAEITGGPGLTFTKLHDPGNGMIQAWGIMAGETVFISLWAFYYQAVFGAGGSSPESDGSRLHPFFFLGYKHGPDDPKGWDWFVPKPLLQLRAKLKKQRRSWARASGEVSGSRAGALEKVAGSSEGVEGTGTGAGAGAERGRGEALGKSVNGVNANFNIARAGVVGVGGEGYAGVNGVEGVPEAGVQGQRGGYGEETEEAGGMGREGEEQQAAGQQGEGAEEAGGRGRGGEGAEAEAEDVAEERQKVELSWKLLEACEGGTPGAGAQAPVPEAMAGGVAGPWAEGMGAGDAATVAAGGAVAGEAGEAAAGAAGAAAGATAAAASGEAVSPAVLLMGLRKVYPSKDGSSPPKVAVQDLYLHVGARESFGLLGPNGAGKSTALRMMQGMLEPSAGSIRVCGLDPSAQPKECALKVGICPQHDTLWSSLSAREHLMCYGRIKGLTSGRPGVKAAGVPGAGQDAESGASRLGVEGVESVDLEGSVEACLRAVGLHGTVADQPCGSYSGGMRRRLSVAIALMGAPSLVYLDEPSTGLDPASKRQLWKAIQGARSSCAIVLTTHYMEEAEGLCDRLGVFVGGRLRCIGSPKELTARFSQSLLLSITTPEEQVERAKALVRDRICHTAKQVYSLGGTQTYELPKSAVSIRDVFRAVLGMKDEGELTVQDWGVSNASLEQVFTRIVAGEGIQDAPQPSPSNGVGGNEGPGADTSL